MVNILSRKAGFIWLALFVTALIVSVAITLYYPPVRARRVLFFPGAITNDLSGELRYLIDRKNRENDMETVLDELILGPVNINHMRVLPKTSDVRTLMFRNDTLFVDFGTQLLNEESEVPLGADEMVHAIERTLYFNFPYLKKVVITVNGQLPKQPYFQMPRE